MLLVKPNMLIFGSLLETRAFRSFLLGLMKLDQGETKDLSDLWVRCVQEAADCSLLIAYIEDGEVFKGGYIEIGVALGNGKPVYLIGNFPGTFMNHPLVSCFDSLDDAFAAL